METIKNVKKGTRIGIIVVSCLFAVCFICLIASFLSADNRNEPYAFVHMIISGVLYLPIVIYAFYGYKKPHGNMLKYVFCLFSVCLLAECIIPSADVSEKNVFFVQVSCGSTALIAAYVAGRLNRIEKNRNLLILAGVLLLVSRVIVYSVYPSNFIRMIGVFAPLVIWAANCLAYTARYEAHKAAGLETD